MRIVYSIAFFILLVSACEAYAGTEIDLSGAWDYRLLRSEQEYPPVNGTVWEKVRLPNRNLFKTIAEKRNIVRGYVLYRKTFTLKDAPAENLAFQAGEIMNADRVYINGKIIGKTGIFPPDFKSGWSKFRHYPIPSEYLLRGENRIDVLNYFDAELWFLSPIRLIDEARGNRDAMFRNFLQVELIHAFCLVLACFSLFFFLIYIKRKKEIMYFYYACATFFLADMMILQFMENLYAYLPLSSETIFKICGIGPMFMPPFLAFFFRSYLEMKVTAKRLAAYLVLPFTCAILMLLAQDRYDIIYWRNIALMLIPLYIADIVIVSVRQLAAGNRKGLVLFIALLPIFILGIFDILVFSLHAIEGSVPLYPIGVPFMAVLIGVQLVNRFIFNLNTSEKLNLLLEEKMEEGKRLASLENEISIARKIQLANVPRSLPEMNAFNIGVKYIPAVNISGDFYNFHAIEQDRLGVLIADVSGHGVPASLIASMVKILFSTLAPLCSNPEMFVKGLNAYLGDKMEGHFLTAGYCYINKSKNKAQYVRAGHEPLLQVTHTNGEAVLREHAPRGRAIGLHADMDLELVEFDIKSGDRLVLYTDGLIEAFNDNREIFGLDRLKKLLLMAQDFSTEKTIDYVFNALRDWSSFNEFIDDFTLIVIDIG